MSYTLYGQLTSQEVKIILTVAHYAGIYITVEESISESELCAVSPTNSLPTLVTPEGAVSQTAAIVTYLASVGNGEPLHGETAFESALVDAWLDWTARKVGSAANVLLPVETMLGNDYYLVKNTVETVIEDLKVLNDHVAKNTFLVGRFISVADIVAAYAVAPFFTELFAKNQQKPFNNLFRWLNTVLAQPTVAVHYGAEFTLCKKSPIPTNPPKKAAGEEAPKEDVVPDVSYLSAIESTMNLEEWKVKYANTDPTRPEAIDYFWSNYDPEGYCMYIFHYKYFEECTVQFKTNNLFGGFIQRTDGIKAMSRNSCASMCVLEKDERFHIWGVWIFKGDELPYPFTATIDDVNYYDWEKVDITNEEQRNLVSDFWAWESADNFGGRGNFVGGKTYGI
eukprot:TRINITY_DN225_c0_g1_i1.p1 TRINITY_DN225_c0_g1~~TRINITY_DN225_c0_g1_i1.p1  ORF type:complete len:395 (-),score=101.28 TRINITY_DN225_c0_g1_i1:50-1234(-)